LQHGALATHPRKHRGSALALDADAGAHVQVVKLPAAELVVTLPSQFVDIEARGVEVTVPVGSLGVIARDEFFELRCNSNATGPANRLGPPRTPLGVTLPLAPR
jgi:hypothetical protein